MNYLKINLLLVMSIIFTQNYDVFHSKFFVGVGDDDIFHSNCFDFSVIMKLSYVSQCSFSMSVTESTLLYCNMLYLFFM